MNYAYAQFKRDFPNDDACLEYIFKSRFAGFKCPKCGKSKFYRVKSRRTYACRCGYHINPVAGTIAHKSDTSLLNWFFAVYLMSQSKNGIAAKEIQHHLETTYKTAWRIASKIRSLMKQRDNILKGTIEADETYIGGRRKGKKGYGDKIPVMGIVQRGGQIKGKKIPDSQTHTLLKELAESIKFGSRVITDDTNTYKPDKIKRLGFFHDTINHSKEQYVKGDIYTNTIEGAFSQLKRSIDGTYHSISAQHLQSYVDAFVFHYNQRFSSVSAFETLLSRLCGLRGSGDYRMPVFEGVKVSS